MVSCMRRGATRVPLPVQGMEASQSTRPVSKLLLENVQDSSQLTQLLQYIVEKSVSHKWNWKYKKNEANTWCFPTWLTLRTCLIIDFTLNHHLSLHNSTWLITYLILNIFITSIHLSFCFCLPERRIVTLTLTLTVSIVRSPMKTHLLFPAFWWSVIFGCCIRLVKLYGSCLLLLSSCRDDQST